LSDRLARRDRQASVLADHTDLPAARSARPHAGADALEDPVRRAHLVRPLRPRGRRRSRARRHALRSGPEQHSDADRRQSQSAQEHLVRMGETVHGVLVVDKPGGMTSHDVVARARRLFGTRAVGHAGTLDPMATGVLVLLFGEACKLSAYLTGQDKTYSAGVRFGSATDSLDADGRVTEERTLPAGWLARETLDRALAVERARTLQVPPAVSAISEGGRRAYQRVRAGETVELAPRPVRVARLELLEWSDAGVDVELEVSKGYYVRA